MKRRVWKSLPLLLLPLLLHPYSLLQLPRGRLKLLGQGLLQLLPAWLVLAPSLCRHHGRLSQSAAAWTPHGRWRPYDALSTLTACAPQRGLAGALQCWHAPLLLRRPGGARGEATLQGQPCTTCDADAISDLTQRRCLPIHGPLIMHAYRLLYLVAAIRHRDGDGARSEEILR